MSVFLLMYGSLAFLLPRADGQRKSIGSFRLRRKRTPPHSLTWEDRAEKRRILQRFTVIRREERIPETERRSSSHEMQGEI